MEPSLPRLRQQQQQRRHYGRRRRRRRRRIKSAYSAERKKEGEGEDGRTRTREKQEWTGGRPRPPPKAIVGSESESVVRRRRRSIRPPQKMHALLARSPTHKLTAASSFSSSLANGRSLQSGRTDRQTDTFPAGGRSSLPACLACFPLTSASAFLDSAKKSPRCSHDVVGRSHDGRSGGTN